MIGQSLGSVYLGWEALRSFTPLYYFDTSGYAFTYPLARLFGCKVICYTHYPTISLDMLSRVRDRNSMYNNDASIARRSVSIQFYGITWNVLKSHRFVLGAVFGNREWKSYITPSSAICMDLLDRALILQWLTLHGPGLTSRSFGRFRIGLSESILLVILLDFRFGSFKFLWIFVRFPKLC